MKKVLLIFGILLLIAGGICLFNSAWNHHLYMTVMDGDGAIFEKLRNAYKTFLAWGIGLDVAGALLLIIRSRL